MGIRSLLTGSLLINVLVLSDRANFPDCRLNWPNCLLLGRFAEKARSKQIWPVSFSNPSLTGLWKGCPVYCGWLIAVGWFSSCCNCNNWRSCSTLAELDVGTPRPLGCREV